MTKLIGLTGAYDFLERMILEPAGARYNPDWKKARENLENSHDENLDYLGTYFPRTVLESAVIFEHLMRTMPSVKKMLAERDVIRVLDFGCGTGGELLGFLIALGWEFNWELPAVEVDAIDGNQDALGMMQDIMHLCRDKWDFDLRVRTVTHKAEKSGFAPANVKLRDDYARHVEVSRRAQRRFPNAVPRLRVRVFRQHRSRRTDRHDGRHVEAASQSRQ